MDKNMENNFSPYMNFDIGADPLLGENPMFNPIMQYEQAYMYYRYLSQQMDYNKPSLFSKQIIHIFLRIINIS